MTTTTIGRRVLPVLLGLALALTPTAHAKGKEGFGMMSKKTARLTRVSPPEVFLMGVKIDVVTTSIGSSTTTASQRLADQLESELISRDRRLRAEPSTPETRVDVNVLESRGSETWENREVTRIFQVGKDAKGKPVYESRQVTVPFKLVKHSFSASYTVTDLVKNSSLVADTIRITYDKDFEEGTNAPALFTLENEAVDSAVDQIARRITPTSEVIGVLLPKGSFEELANLAIGGQWNRYLEALEAMPPRPGAADDAYRQYAIGTAYEALGYASEEADVTLRYLEQADVHYGKAIDGNPGEKFFLKPYDAIFTSKRGEAPLDRVRQALVGYRRIKDFQERYASLQANAEAQVAAKSLEQEKAVAGMGNAAVIQMVEAGLPEEVILNAIDTAPEHNFDVSPKGLIELSTGRVGKSILLHIQKLANGKKATAAKPAPKAKSR